MEAGDSCSPILKDNFLEPTGFPVFKKSSTISEKISLDLAFRSFKCDGKDLLKLFFTIFRLFVSFIIIIIHDNN